MVARADRFLQRLLGGGLDDVDEVGAASSRRCGGRAWPTSTPSIGRSCERLAEDRLARRQVGREHEQRAVQPARAAQRGVDVPRMVRRAEHEHAVVVGLRAVELRQQLVDDVAARRVAQVAALLAERVELVQEEHARRGAARRLERVVQAALGLAEPHVEHVVEAEREEARAELARDGAREERLAAAGRAVHQQAAAERLAVVRPQLRVAQRREERGVQARLDLLQAADVVERDPRALRLDQALGVQLREALGDRDRLLRSSVSAQRGPKPGTGSSGSNGGGVVPSKLRRMRAYESARAVSPSARAASRAATSASASSGAVCSAACACSSARPASPPITSSDARCTRNAGIARVGDDRRLQSGGH